MVSRKLSAFSHQQINVIDRQLIIVPSEGASIQELKGWGEAYLLMRQAWHCILGCPLLRIYKENDPG